MKANHICGPESSCDTECMNQAAEDAELRDGFKRILEQEMVALIQSVEQLIEMHKTYNQDTMQKSYLWKARRELISGKDWFDWERRQKARSSTPSED